MSTQDFYDHGDQEQTRELSPEEEAFLSDAATEPDEPIVIESLSDQEIQDLLTDETPVTNPKIRKYEEPYDIILKRYPLLSPEEELRLAVACKAGDQEARDTLIQSNVRLVFKLAQKYWSSKKARSSFSGNTWDASIDDLIQDGMVGLITAIDSYAPEMGIRISTYVTYQINRQILTRLNQTSHAVTLYNARFAEINVLRRAYDRVVLALGRAPSPVELYLALGGHMTMQTIKYLYNFIIDKVSSLENVDWMLASSDPGPETQAMDNDLYDALHYAIDHDLTEIERSAILGLYGFEGEDKTLQQVAKSISRKVLYKLDGTLVKNQSTNPTISRQWVQQNYKRALKKLKIALKQRGYDYEP